MPLHVALRGLVCYLYALSCTPLLPHPDLATLVSWPARHTPTSGPLNTRFPLSEMLLFPHGFFPLPLKNLLKCHHLSKYFLNHSMKLPHLLHSPHTWHQFFAIFFFCSVFHHLAEVQNVHCSTPGGTTFMVVYVNGPPGVMQCTTCAAIHTIPTIRHTANLALLIYMTVLFADVSQCLEQCLTHKRHSVNICRINERMGEWISVALNNAAPCQLRWSVRKEESCVLMDVYEPHAVTSSSFSEPFLDAGSPTDNMLSALTPF